MDLFSDLKKTFSGGESTSQSMRGDMSARVQDAIHRQQDASERLIAWAQLAIVSTFGILYACRRKHRMYPPG
ncbi:MAG: hypothetical protein ACJAU6_000436 [Alphaproteobacteria bacterium]